MAGDHHSSMGAEYLKETQRNEPKLLFFSVVLLISHILHITPSDFDIGGVKISVKDASIIYGGLSLIVVYYIYTIAGLYFSGNALLPINLNKRIVRNMLRVAKRPYKSEAKKRMIKRTPKHAKRYAWRAILFYNIFIVPYALAVVFIVFIAFITALFDLWDLGVYIWNMSPGTRI